LGQRAIREILNYRATRKILSHRVVRRILSIVTGDIVGRDVGEGINYCLQYRRNWRHVWEWLGKGGGEMLENVNGKLVLFSAVYCILRVII
jgi:hypothetical protein